MHQPSTATSSCRDPQVKVIEGSFRLSVAAPVVAIACAVFTEVKGVNP